MNVRYELILAVSLLFSQTAIAGGDFAAGQEKSKVCQQCHGVDGNSASAQFPRLAGQHADYLVRALQEYKGGKRKNPIMLGFAGNLSLRDMEDLATYFSSQHGLTIDPPRPAR